MKFSDVMAGVLPRLQSQFQGNDARSQAAQDQLRACAAYRNFDALIRAYNGFVTPDAYGRSIYDRHCQNESAAIRDAAKGKYDALNAVMKKFVDGGYFTCSCDELSGCPRYVRNIGASGSRPARRKNPSTVQAQQLTL